MINTSDAVYIMHTLYLFFSFGLAVYRHDTWFAFVLPKHCSLSADNESNLIKVKKKKKNLFKCTTSCLIIFSGVF